MNLYKLSLPNYVKSKGILAVFKTNCAQCSHSRSLASVNIKHKIQKIRSNNLSMQFNSNQCLSLIIAPTETLPKLVCCPHLHNFFYPTTHHIITVSKRLFIVSKLLLTTMRSNEFLFLLSLGKHENQPP